jgi:hypothetical protein
MDWGTDTEAGSLPKGACGAAFGPGDWRRTYAADIQDAQGNA